MTSPQKKKFKLVWLGYAAMLLVFLVVGGWLLKTFLFADDPQGRRKVHMVTLVKPPPPPPPPKEEPPPPEPEEELIPPEPEPLADTPDDSADDSPASENLGVDAEGTAGGDSFGLVGNKGGRGLIGGGLGESSLLRKYAWYTRMVQDEIRRELKAKLEKNGGWPDKGQNAKVKIVLDPTGLIVDFSLVTSSGDKILDQTVLAVLPNVRMREPPPQDMPLALFIRVAPRG